MSYFVGEEVDLTFDVEVDGTDESPTAFSLTITQPDGTDVVLVPSEDPAGHFVATFQVVQPGHHSWVAISTGIISVATGVFDAFSTNPQTAPLTGLAAPWTDPAALCRRPEIIAYNEDHTDDPIPPYILSDACRYASEILYALSGRQFSGLARTYCRPLARPEGWDVRSWGAALYPSYWQGWGSSYSMGYGAASVLASGYRAQRGYPAEIPLNFPVQRIEAVKINGTLLDADQYGVDDYRLLVRMKPTAGAVPTEQYGWPSWQRLDLPDTEPSTFSVTYWYGSQAPVSGIVAAQVFAAELALDMIGADNRLPSRITEISRQGESIAVIDSLQSLQQGWTGIPACDWFIATQNPHKLQRRGAVWTPDMGRVRTPTNGG